MHIHNKEITYSAKFDKESGRGYRHALGMLKGHSRCMGARLYDKQMLYLQLVVQRLRESILQEMEIKHPHERGTGIVPFVSILVYRHLG